MNNNDTDRQCQLKPCGENKGTGMYLFQQGVHVCVGVCERERYKKVDIEKKREREGVCYDNDIKMILIMISVILVFCR